MDVYANELLLLIITTKLEKNKNYRRDELRYATLLVSYATLHTSFHNINYFFKKKILLLIITTL